MINGKPWTLEELENDTSQSYLKNSKRGRENDFPTTEQLITNQRK